MESERLKQLLSDNGEVIVSLRSGRSFELHLHDTEFEDGNVVIDHDEEYYEFDPYDVTDVEVHSSGPL